MPKPIKKISAQAIAAFLVTLSLCCVLVLVVVYHSTQIERLTMETLALERGSRISETLSRLLHKTQTLSVYIQRNHGEVTDFEEMAFMLMDDPAILNILIAPGGVVSEVYPLEGNEAVIGLDFFAEGAGNREAILARQTGELVLGGPFDAVQGGQILVGRLPVFFDEPGGSQRFWGIVSVTLRYPEVLDYAGLSELSAMNLGYEIWRINADNDERQMIAYHPLARGRSASYAETHLSIMNADWYFGVLSPRAHHAFPEAWLTVAASVIISLMAAAIMQSYQDLKRLKNKLETLSTIDPLTGIHNRRYFMHAVALQMNRVARQKGDAFIIIWDLDHFKAVNDQYGHQAGDIVLKETAGCVAEILRPYDISARYGGEEFIIFISETDKEATVRLVERIRLAIAQRQINVSDAGISVTASFGVAPAAPAYNLEETIAFADKALYKAKEEGRNRIVFYE